MTVSFVAGPALAPAGDFRAINNDQMDVVYDTGYCDMPYLADCGDGVVVMVGTISNSIEGGDTERVTISRSVDGGRSFAAAVDIEPVTGPEAAWCVPYYHTGSGRLWVFYTYNYENVRSIPIPGGSSPRVDIIGKIACRYSTDKGVTWSARQLLDLPAKAVDLRNPFGGSRQIFWMYGRVSFYADRLFMGFSKSANAALSDNEGFILRLNIDPTTGAISNPLQLPSTGDVGIRNPDNSNITEEPDVLIDPSDGLITVFSRNDRGKVAESYSTDGGVTFTTDWARYSDGTTTIPNPRGPASIFRLPDGRPMLWFYNNSRSDYQGRSTYWYAFGERVGNRIRFGTPHVFVFSPPGKRLNYGDCLARGEELIVSMSNKETGSFTILPLPQH